MAAFDLGNGRLSLVDDADYERLCVYSWRGMIDIKTGHWYAYRSLGRTGNCAAKKVYLHNEVMGVVPGSGFEVDHREPECTLDNRRSNLRVSTRSENNCNRGMRRDNSSGYKGVSPGQKGGWVAQIMKHKKQYNLGTFQTKEDAYAAYCEAAIRLHGEFARLA